MARLATTSDVFNAVAEPRRRAILGLLARGERTVGYVARRLRLRQPQASKHLGVLKKVGLVGVRRCAQQRFYALNGAGLKPMHDWVVTFERFWREGFDRLDDYLQTLQEQRKNHGRKGK